MNNAILKTDNNGIQINKSKNSNKIDPIAALINAYVFAMDYFTTTEGAKADNEFYTSEEFSFTTFIPFFYFWIGVCLLLSPY